MRTLSTLYIASWVHASIALSETLRRYVLMECWLQLVLLYTAWKLVLAT